MSARLMSLLLQLCYGPLPDFDNRRLDDIGPELVHEHAREENGDVTDGCHFVPWLYL